jgi:2-oxoglutarate dehydrogenase E2 component (dihydrolipoamide succinyltransferase)
MSKIIDVVLPVDQVEGTRSQVQRWLIDIGQAARRDEPPVEIETDKVTVEVPAPADGVLVEIVAPEGTDVAPGALPARARASQPEPPWPPARRGRRWMLPHSLRFR